MEDKLLSGGSSDESLDVKSDKFDPLKALYSEKCKPPISNARIFDNVSKYETVVTKGLSTFSVKESSKGNFKLNTDGTTQRKFLPHQAPIPSRGRRGALPKTDQDISEKNVLTRMKGSLGPLEMLLKCMEQRTRVKVFTRGARTMRGYILAYVAAFDKHWNLALEDCIEVWTRKVKKKAKAPALGVTAVEESGKDEGGGVDDDEIKRSIKIEEEFKLMVIKDNKKGKTETVERHVPQLLVRGEQIAIIVKIE